MASKPADPATADDDEYQVQYADEVDDDERTIEEEEQLASEDEDNELDDLEEGANMPLEELLKLYGQNAPIVNRISQGNDDESSTSSDEDNDHPHRFHRLLQVNGQLLRDDDDDDTDDSFEPEIVKSIHVGDEYQAQVELQAEFDSVNAHSDDRKVPVDELLWSPPSSNEIENEGIDDYLKAIRNEFPFADDEISLKILLHCHMKIDLAMIQFRQLPVKKIYSYREWSEDEIQSFENGVQEYGKDFFKITQFKCPNRSIREVIHYYYQWKKTDRCRLFLEEQQRLHAITSATDMIKRLIEEQEEQLCAAVGVNNSNDLIINSSISFVTTTTTKRSFDQVDHDTESSSSTASKKPSLATIV